MRRITAGAACTLGSLRDYGSSRIVTTTVIIAVGGGGVLIGGAESFMLSIPRKP